MACLLAASLLVTWQIHGQQDMAKDQQKKRHDDFMQAVCAGEMAKVKDLLKIDSSLAGDDSGGPSFPPLHQAAGRGKKEIAELLITSGADVNATRWYGAFLTHSYTALHLAASNGHREVVDLLLAHGADVNAKNTRQEAFRGDNWAMTPMHSAVIGGNAAIVKALIEAKAKPDEPNYGGLRPLYYAAKNGATNIVALLLEDKTDVNAKARKTGSNPACPSALHIAARSGPTGIVRMLISHKADVTVKDEDGRTPLDEARDQNHADVVRLLEDAQKK